MKKARFDVRSALPGIQRRAYPQTGARARSQPPAARRPSTTSKPATASGSNGERITGIWS